MVATSYIRRLFHSPCSQRVSLCFSGFLPLDRGQLSLDFRFLAFGGTAKFLLILYFTGGGSIVSSFRVYQNYKKLFSYLLHKTKNKKKGKGRVISIVFKKSENLKISLISLVFKVIFSKNMFTVVAKANVSCMELFLIEQFIII